jgi:hypothetical protein
MGPVGQAYVRDFVTHSDVIRRLCRSSNGNRCVERTRFARFIDGSGGIRITRSCVASGAFIPPFSPGRLYSSCPIRALTAAAVAVIAGQSARRTRAYIA